jgi:uncharacterized damage-inducible protein DinB
MTPDYIRMLIEYNYWARDRMLASAEQLSPEQLSRNLGSSFGSVLGTLLHMQSAEWVWYHRWHGESPTTRADQTHLRTVDAVRDAWAPLERDVRAFVEGLGSAGLARVIDYRTLDGQPGSSAYWQMIVHVVNHGSYHRGQVATMLRQLGVTPAQSTDMILFFREHVAVTQHAVGGSRRVQ